MKAKRLLIVDDEPAIRFAIRGYFTQRGYDVSEAASCDHAIEVLRGSFPDVAVVDYRLGDGTALDLLHAPGVTQAVPIVVLTAYGSIHLAVEAIKAGADNFVTKPVELPALEVMLERAIESFRQKRHDRVRRTREEREAVDPFVGVSGGLRHLEIEARRAAEVESPILIRGETGSGKGVLAKWLHEQGPRAAEPFVEINCAGLSRELLESELFGYEKGAFTGASGSKSGLFEIAHHGTLFLDEIGDLDPQVQPKLLKVVEQKRFRRLGDIRERRVDVRLIAATHRDLRRAVEEGTFRADLYYRLSTLPLVVPPLRERPQDIARLGRVLVRQLAAQLGRPRARLAADAEAALATHTWPGNVRELRNVLERAMILNGEVEVRAEHLRFDTAGIAGGAAPVSPGETLRELEIRQIEQALTVEGGSVSRAAKRLGIPRSTLYYKVKKYGLRDSES